MHRIVVHALRFAALCVLLVLGAEAIGSDAGAAVERALDHASDATAHGRDLTRLRGISPLVGLLLIGLALIPLFAGWRFLRLALGLLVGVFLALWVWTYALPFFQSLSTQADTVRLLHIVGAGLAFVVGFALGWILYQTQMALAGAALGMMVFSLPGLYLDQPLVTLGLMIVGAIVGAVIGWMAAPYWAAVQTAILGGFLVVQGVAILMQAASDDTMRTVAYAVGGMAGLVGLICQCIWIARRPGAAPVTSSGG